MDALYTRSGKIASTTTVAKQMFPMRTTVGYKQRHLTGKARTGNSVGNAQ